MKRRARILVLAGYLVAGGFITQAGTCWIMGVNSLIPGVAEGFVDSNGRLFGLVNVCGLQNVLVVPANGTGAGTLFNYEDDLVTVCPFVVEVEQTTTGGTGGGGV